MNPRLQKPLSILLAFMLVINALTFFCIQANPDAYSQEQAAQPAKRAPAGMPDELLAAFLKATSQPFEAGAESYHARSGGMDFTLDASGLQASGEGLAWGLALSGFGRAGQIAPVSEPQIAQADGRLEYHRAALTEWYRNTALGVEQGFTINQAPGGAGPLILELDLLTGSEDLAVTADVSGGLSFALPTGQALRYDHLRAWDAAGAPLGARLSYAAGQVMLEVDDQAAAYPITVDPLIYAEQKVIAADGAAGNGFGYSVALSGDTALLGAIGANSAYVFTRSGTAWTQQAKLVANDGTLGDYFGYSVALSGDTALVGAPGSAYVFVRSGTVWIQQAKLTASDGYFGNSVALSGDTALVGAPGANSAYVFTRSGTTWTQQAQLTAADGDHNDDFGISVALSGDTALVGAAMDNVGGNSGQGSAYIFTRSGTLWTQQAQLIASDSESINYFGFSVALSGDTALVGAIAANDYKGSAYVFTRSETTWTQQAQLTASDGAVYDYFGWSVALSGDTALLGANYNEYGANIAKGPAYVFTRSGTTWAQKGKLTASDGTWDDDFGESVALSGDTALVGAPGDDGGQGSAYFYDITFLDHLFYLPLVSRSAP